MKFNRYQQRRKGSLSGLLLVSLLFISIAFAVATFRAAPNESQPVANLNRIPILGPLLPPPNGTILTVLNANDSGPGSLRQALADAHDGDTIQFAAALSGGTITLTTAQLVIQNSVTIQGPGPTLLTVQRDSHALHFRIFNVTPGHNVAINGLTITGGYIEDNGGGLLNDQSTLTIANCTISGNLMFNTPSFVGGGGGIHNAGTLTLVDSTVSGNQAYFGGNPNGPLGGGISNSGSLTIINAIVQSNFSIIGAGGIWNEGTMTVTGTTITGNGASSGHFGGFAGGIGNSGKLRIQNSVISQNFAGGDLDIGSGGGISNGGDLEIFHSAIISNRATTVGGGISGGCTITDSVISNNGTFRTPGSGGGLNGDFIIANCTIEGNESAGDGGGIASNTSVITNSTISGNSAVNGGGIAGGGNIAFTTFSGNSASSNGGTIYLTSPLELGNTILTVGAAGATIFNNGGSLTSQGYNLSSDDAAGLLTGPGDQIKTDPLLGPLQNNGGPTFTHALLPGSPAIDMGDPNFTPPPQYDQRGFGYLRVYNGRLDSGSYEAQPTATISPTPTATATSTATVTATATASPPTPTPTPAVARSLELSTRVLVKTGDEVAIAGFIVSGNSPKNVAVRGLGPSLVNQGVPDPLADPIIEVHGPPGFPTIIQDNCNDTQCRCQWVGIGPPDPQLEACELLTLDPGAYTLILRGKNNGTGVGLVEVYDLGEATSQLANISTRGFASVIIGGFILGPGINNPNVLVRGLGPSLAGSGIDNYLTDPLLSLYDMNGDLLASNDNCTGSSLPPPNPLESCIETSLSPGAYTAIVVGQNGGTGVGLVEIYNLQ